MKAPSPQLFQQMRRSFNNGGDKNLMASEKLISLLPPMKRIICFCPVLLDMDDKCCDEKIPSGTNNFEVYSISAAISDPYLSFATPLKSKGAATRWMDRSLYIPKDFSTSTGGEGKSKQPVFWRNLPQSQDELLMQVGEEYNDIGGVVFGLPIKLTHDSNNVNIKDVRDVLRNELGNLQTLHSSNKNCNRSLSLRPFNLQCQIDDQVTLDEALKRANEQPEMWEELNLSSFLEPDLGRSRNHPKCVSNHAAAALNTFLWEVSGGW
eukprot:CAMPEP_0203675412 /NCGR_PEP_ID=MMETSP0090-20130426/20279_1 /ASSEMBLY_ACC=CAM_ASM_001088 /TAXON_ID=426623 /ORGANISM="Chaetoceros affinis, Strain CCMP159" /LENGTH=264 /DNA_ID=CAMNT_0050541599 /DNA_START=76 /DNA_END=867 /DNA_ORIENTATION=+